MGEKPLYLVERKDELIFASELKALLKSGAVPFELDETGVYLFSNYQYVPEPATPIRGVRITRLGSTSAGAIGRSGLQRAW